MGDDKIIDFSISFIKGRLFSSLFRITTPYDICSLLHILILQVINKLLIETIQSEN